MCFAFCDPVILTCPFDLDLDEVSWWTIPVPSLAILVSAVFTCVSYAEARNRYRLDVCIVCPSVRLSVTRWYCIKTAEYIVKLSSPHDSPFILVLCVSRSSRNSNGVTPAVPLNRGGVWKYRHFRPITCYISKTVEDRLIHAARRLTSIDCLSIHVKFTAIVPGAYTGEAKMCKKCAKMANF